MGNKIVSTHSDENNKGRVDTIIQVFVALFALASVIISIFALVSSESTAEESRLLQQRINLVIAAEELEITNNSNL